MKKVYILTLIFSIFLISCEALISENISKSYASLPIESKIAILDIKHSVPENSEKLGVMSFEDNGFSIDCDYYSNLSKARTKARKIGANIIKITNDSSPNFFSSCYRMNVTFYIYNGDVSQLPQIQLQQN